MVVAIGALAVIGILFVYSASFIAEDQPASRYQRQAMWLVIGAVCYLCVALSDYRRLSREAWWVFGGTIVLLVLVLLVGTKVYGARRWLMFLGVSIQPAEFAKIAFVMVLARYLSRPDLDLDTWRTMGSVLLIAGIPFVLIVAEPDLGTAMVFLPVAFVMMLVARLRTRMLVTLASAGIVGSVIVLSAVLLPERLGCNEETQERIINCVGLKLYHKSRLETFLDPDKDPLGAGWNKMQSEIAIGSGGLMGKGYLNGTANILGFLPKTVAPTDFIFAVVAEEKGFMGATTVLLLFCVVIGSGMWAAVSANDKLGRLLCVGVSTLIFTHVFVNVAMTVGILPIAGIPLPLMSSGGSFVVGMLAGLGMIQSVYARRRYLR